MASTELDAVDDKTILAIAAQATEDLQPDEPGPASRATTEDEARLVIAQLLEQFGDQGPVDPAQILADPAEGAAAGRRVLEVMLDDPEAAPSVRSLIADPPGEEQMSITAAIGTAVVLGLLVTWLQTKFSLTVKRHDGKTDIALSIRKDAAPPDVIKNIIKAVTSALGPGE